MASTSTTTSPADGATNVATPVTLSGDCDANEALRIRGDWIGGTSDWISATCVAGVWTADAAMSPPSGAVVDVRVQCKADDQAPEISPNGWVLPAGTGNRIDSASLTAFNTPNDGPNANVIDDAFITASAGASWLSFEAGVPVISGVYVPRGLRINTQIILRDCTIESVHRDQTASGNWGFFQDDAPVVYIDFSADDTVIEYCTITGLPWNHPTLGFPAASNADIDTNIVARTVRVAGENSTIQYCDMSGCRGSVQSFRGTTVQYNYIHDYAFGWQEDRQGGTQGGLPDEVTHNNGVSNQGYENVTVQFNYIDARYGRVSALQPGDAEYPFRLTPIFRNTVYNNGVEPGEVVVGDPIDGFTFTNRQSQGDGSGYTATDNYVAYAGRVFGAAGTALATDTGADDLSRNVFEFDRFDDFQGITDAVQPFASSMAGSCNQQIENGVATVLPAEFFDGNTHGTTGCTLAVADPEVAGGDEICWNEATPTPAGLNGLAATFGPGALPGPGLAVLDHTGEFFPDEPIVRFRHENDTPTAAAAVANGSYIEYALTGNDIEIEEVSFLVAKGGASDPRGWELRSSADNYATTIATATATNQDPVWDPRVTVDTSAVPSTDNLTFRLYVYTPIAGNILYVDEFCATACWIEGIPTQFTVAGVFNTVPVAQDNTFNATVGTAASFDYTVNDTLGDAPNSYAFVSGALPPGMGINTGPAPDITNRVTGTPTTAGTYTFTYSLTDGDGEQSQADITVIVAAADTTPVAVNDNFTFTVGTFSTADLSLNDDPANGPSTWAFTDAFPSVPPGMTLNPSTGVISGTPTTVGVYQDQYNITDNDGDVSAQATYTITIQAANTGAPTATNDDLGTVPCDVALNFSVATNDALGDGTAGQHTWAFVSGAIPPGLTLSSAGLLAGTPTTPGSYQFTYSLQDVDGDQDTATVTVVVAEKTTGDGPALVDDFDTAAQVGVAYSFDVTANDDLGVTPTIVSYDSGNVPPGLTFAAGILSGTPTIAGTYQFVYVATDANGQADTATATIVVAEADGPAPGECCEIALTFLTVEADGPATSCCDPRPLIVDANGGTAYANGFDAAGNPAVVVPGFGVAKDAVTYNSAAGQVPPAECCLTNEDINRPVYDYAQNCVTHICMGPSLGWRAICGNDDGSTVEPPPDAEVERVCYSTTGILPGAYGGTGTGWLVSGLQQLDIACEGAVTGSPTFIGFNDDFCDDGANVLTNGSFYPNAAVYPLTYTDTGQTAAADANGITDPTCFNSIFAVDFATSMSTGDSAPTYSFDVTAVVGGSPINFAFYNNVTGIIEPIASAAGGGSIQNNPASPGDYYNVTTAGTSHTVTLLNDVSPADVTMMILAMSSSNVFDDDRVENIEVSYVAEGDCCNAVNTAADLAALFTANDPIGNTWTIIGSTVCSDMPIGQGASYGVLQLCDVGPVTPTIGFP